MCLCARRNNSESEAAAGGSRACCIEIELRQLLLSHFAAHLVYNYNNNNKSNPFHFGLHCTVARLSAHIPLSNPIEPFLKWEMLKTNTTTRRMLATGTGEGGVDV